MKKHTKKLRKIDHLIRYFVGLGFLAAFGYIYHCQEPVFLFLVGPLIYISSPLQNSIESVIGPMNHSISTNLYGFLLPVCVVYFGVLGFQLKQLWNEQGFVRLLSMFALIAFIVFIHYTAWQNLTGYFTPIT